MQPSLNCAVPSFPWFPSVASVARDRSGRRARVGENFSHVSLGTTEIGRYGITVGHYATAVMRYGATEELYAPTVWPNVAAVEPRIDAISPYGVTVGRYGADVLRYGGAKRANSSKMGGFCKCDIDQEAMDPGNYLGFRWQFGAQNSDSARWQGGLNAPTRRSAICGDTMGTELALFYRYLGKGESSIVGRMDASD